MDYIGSETLDGIVGSLPPPGGDAPRRAYRVQHITLQDVCGRREELDLVAGPPECTDFRLNKAVLSTWLTTGVEAVYKSDTDRGLPGF